MADQKVTSLPATTTLLGTDIIPVVTDPGGTPTNKKITKTDLVTSIAALPLTGGTITGATTFNSGLFTAINAIIKSASNGVNSVLVIKDSGASTVWSLEYTDATGGLRLFGASSAYPLTVSNPIAMGSNKVTGLAAGSVNGDALRYEQLIGLYLLLTGGTMSGAIAMGSNKITGLTNGSSASDAAAFGQVPVITAGQIVGTATNDSATAGNVGEYVSSAVTPAYPITLTSTQYADVTSISLTAGDWDVTGMERV